MFWRDTLKSQADVIYIQETHLLANDVPFLFHSTANIKRAGITIQIKASVFSTTRPQRQKFIFTMYTKLEKIHYPLVICSQQISFLWKTIHTQELNTLAAEEDLHDVLRYLLRTSLRLRKLNRVNTS